ncbi:MAG: PHP domain-containing protein [Chitinophagales bacterium]
MLSNKEVGSVFKTLAGLMELHGENDFKTRTYSNAAFQVGRVPKPVLSMELKDLETTQGIGKSVAAKIVELRETGTMQALEDLITITPPGLLEVLRIKGLGGKKVRVIWDELGVEDVGSLLYACYENRLSKLKGFGEKTQQSVIQAIEYYQSNAGKFHYATLADHAIIVEEQISAICAPQHISIAGDLRRQSDILESMDYVLACSATAFSQLLNGTYFEEVNIAEDVCTAKTPEGIRVRIFRCDDAQFYFTLFTHTGPAAHVDHIIQKAGEANYVSEEAIYLQAGMKYREPFLRDLDINFEPDLPNILQMEDIRGVVHNHSTWSDGKNTLEEMVVASKEMGYDYFVISDHSKTAVYAGGLSVEQIYAQQEEIAKLRNKYPDFTIFSSIECDILNDGSMDYPDDVLKTFDFVIASVHQNLKMDAEKANARLLRAIENPYTTILGHMTGRLLLSRPGYPVDHKRIIDACAAQRVVIELNANPYRLDMDHSWIPYAMEKGVMISIDPDAHSTEGIADIRWGVISARKGALTKQMTWNAMDAAGIRLWLQERRKAKGIL